MGRGTITLLILLLGACTLNAAAVGASEKGQIGGPPTIKLGPPVEGKRTSPALVIGRGSTAEGPAEIVAYGWKSEADSAPDAFCVWAEQLPDQVLFGTCGIAPFRAGSIGMEMKIQTVQPRSARATYIGGVISPDVASVRISFRRPGSSKRFKVKPILGQVNGDLQQRLRQPAPFGFYYAQVKGLVKFRHVRVEALDAEGAVIATRGR